MGDVFSFNIAGYVSRLNEIMKTLHDQGIFILDDIHEYPTIIQHPHRYPVRGDYARYTKNVIVELARECLYSCFQYADKVDPNYAFVDLLGSCQQEVVDWFLTLPMVDSLMVELACAARGMFKSSDIHRAVMSVVNGDNIVMLLGRDYRITMFEDSQARELKRGSWTKDIRGLVAFLQNHFAQPAGNLPPLASVISIETIINIGLATQIPYIRINKRESVEMVLSTVGMSIGSVGALLTHLLTTSGIIGAIRSWLNPSITYNFSLSNRGRITLEPATDVSATDRRFFELEEVVNQGGYLPRDDREFYERELRRR